MTSRAPGMKAPSPERRVAAVTRSVIFAIPGDLSLPTGGYAYDRRVLALADAHCLSMRHLALPGSYPQPTPIDLAETARLIATAPTDAILMIDGLAYGAMPIDLIRNFNRPVVALVHHPLGLESGLSDERREAFIASERAALSLADEIIVTSPLTARVLIEEFAAPQAKITVAEPGVDPMRRAQGGMSERLQLLAVGSIVPRKGYDVLIEALATLADRDWALTIAGADDRAPQATALLRKLINAHRLSERVILRGAVSEDELAALYDRADLFVMSSRYEGYGMALAEAMACGLPIVATTGGAAAETVPDGAGLKVAPDNAPALAAAIAQALDDRSLRERLADAAWSAGQTLPRWDDTAARIASALAKVMLERKA